MIQASRHGMLPNWKWEQPAIFLKLADREGIQGTVCRIYGQCIGEHGSAKPGRKRRHICKRWWQFRRYGFAHRTAKAGDLAGAQCAEPGPDLLLGRGRSENTAFSQQGYGILGI